ncbi:hypothetical protein FRC06_007623 [Ceratobasidium sp. 370]|nr:hypothetical protein FRC06_007623 [Ceratobasidium sp. 370]
MFDLSDELSDKKIVDFTDEELLAARFIGDGDSKSAPFALPAPGDRWFTIPNKTVHGPWDKVLTRELWNTVAPQIISRVLKARGIKYQSLMAVRFSSPNATGKVTLGPIIIWIGTHAGTTTPDTAHNVSPDILSILGEHGINGAEVEWYEARV